MRNDVTRVSFILLCGLCLAGCAFNTHGNREDDYDRRLLTRSKDLPRFVNQQVTLVGTARTLPGGEAAIELRGGTVALPAYDWPAGTVDQRVSVTGLLFEDRRKDEARTYRLGEVKTATPWSR